MTVDFWVRNSAWFMFYNSETLGVFSNDFSINDPSFDGTKEFLYIGGIGVYPAPEGEMKEFLIFNRYSELYTSFMSYDTGTLSILYSTFPRLSGASGI